MFITDSAMSLEYQIYESSMVGDIIELNTERNTSIINKKHYLLEIEQIVLDPNKPGEECITYEEESGYTSYADCVSLDHEKKLFPELGCNIPWMTNKNVCTGFIKTNYSQEAMRYLKGIINNAQTAIFHPIGECKVPCVKTLVKSKYVSNIETVNGLNSIYLHFNPTVKVSLSVSHYNGFDLTVEIGSALGLWLGLSAIGLFEGIVRVLIDFISHVRNLYRIQID